MQTVFSQRLLAQLRIPREEEEIRGDDTFHDPDDRGSQLSITVKEAARDEIYALPAAQAEQTSERGLYTLEQSNAPQSPLSALEAANTSALPDLLDPMVFRTMPARVAAFMLYEPCDPPRWRTSQPPDGLDDGAWCG